MWLSGYCVAADGPVSLRRYSTIALCTCDERQLNVKLAWHNWCALPRCGLYKDLCCCSSVLQSVNAVTVNTTYTELVCLSLPQPRSSSSLLSLSVAHTHRQTHTPFSNQPLTSPFSLSSSNSPSLFLICMSYTPLSQNPPPICFLIRWYCESDLIKLEVRVVIPTVDHYNYS